MEPSIEAFLQITAIVLGIATALYIVSRWYALISAELRGDYGDDAQQFVYIETKEKAKAIPAEPVINRVVVGIGNDGEFIFEENHQANTETGEV